MPENLSRAVRAFTFSLPEGWEDHPWGDTVAKVGKKVFVFLGAEEPDDGGCWLGVKLPQSKEDALALPFTQPMGYGLGRAGWVAIQAPHDMPLDVLTAWVEESYRAVAGRTLVRRLDEERGTAGAPGDV